MMDIIATSSLVKVISDTLLPYESNNLTPTYAFLKPLPPKIHGASSKKGLVPLWPTVIYFKSGALEPRKRFSHYQDIVQMS
ncbi:hypothetical protein [Parasitella parasitica]|uniref:Uncharacterized protein n=1 Tax=Parasitella parasitica TaxID=35722 RepID=A0A0B7N5H2_9FUNG|nr:hypothetical protein [Parasitella parasitica]